MRQDMDKVIVERPRIGSRMKSRKKGYRKYLQSTPLEELPSREPMLGRWKGRSKWLNEHLGPMRRFLRSNLGRLWNDVHSELCEHVSFENAVQSHVLDHIYDFVHRRVELREGQIISISEWGYSRALRLGEMYICPRTTILKEVNRRKTRTPPARVQIDAVTQAIKRENDWWEVRVRHLPDDPGDLWDVWLERDVADLTQELCIANYGGKLFAISKRPLKPNEVKQLRKKIRQMMRCRK